MPVTLKDIMAYFEMPMAQFSKEWKQLTEVERKSIKAGIENGTYDY